MWTALLEPSSNSNPVRGGGLPVETLRSGQLTGTGVNGEIGSLQYGFTADSIGQHPVGHDAVGPWISVSGQGIEYPLAWM